MGHKCPRPSFETPRKRASSGRRRLLLGLRLNRRDTESVTADLKDADGELA